MNTTTRLSDVRAFLDRWGGPAPWTPAPLALQGVLHTVTRHRDDPAFWTELRQLATRLDDHRFTPRRAAEILDDRAIDGLVVALRAHLPDPETRPGLRAWAGALPSAKALAGFAMLGLAAACTGSSETKDSSPAATTPEPCDEAVDHSIAEDEADTYCALVDLIEGAGISDDDRQTILDCLPEYDAAERETLLADWSSATEAELLQMLDDVADDCDDTWTGTH